MSNMGEENMGKFKVITTGIADLLIIEPTVFGDARGFFMEFYNKHDFFENGLNMEFVQDNHSKSKKGVLRGLHFQTKHPQGKLVRVIRGSVWDVAVDLRKNSSTFGKWFGIELSALNKRMFYVPEGFAHGFLTLEDETEFMYKCTDFYHPEDETGIFYNDPSIGIKWPLFEYGINGEQMLLSEKDAKLPTFKEYLSKMG